MQLWSDLVKVDTFLADGLIGADERAAHAEQLGFDAVWCGEIAHDPLLPLAAAARTTETITLGTGIALAFARSPMTLAYQAWDLARVSGGRFVLGLGTQVKAHITRRFSMPWDRPGPQMRDYVQALRAIFHSFQTGEPLDHHGTHYQHTFLTPLFNPGPLPDGHQPQISLAVVGDTMTAIAGELFDGVMLHVFTNTAYIESVTIPALEAGAARAGRSDRPWRQAYFFAIVGDTEAEQEASMRAIRKQLAFYGSTPNYVEVLRAVGCEDIQPELLQLSKQGRWDDMARVMTDDIVDHFAVRGTLEELPGQLAARFAGRVDRLGSYYPLPDYDPDRISDFISTVRDRCTRPVVG
jgi:probable F420-dependent oxidoreductase